MSGECWRTRPILPVPRWCRRSRSTAGDRWQTNDAQDPIGDHESYMRRPQIDLIIPVYNEGANILATLGALAHEISTPTRVLICHDTEDDDTLPAVRNNPDVYAGLDILFVRNPGSGAHAAVLAGFAASTAPIVVLYPADDDFNAGIID